jgi:hypothetical protein
MLARIGTAGSTAVAGVGRTQFYLAHKCRAHTRAMGERRVVNIVVVTHSTRTPWGRWVDTRTWGAKSEPLIGTLIWRRSKSQGRARYTGHDPETCEKGHSYFNLNFNARTRRVCFFTSVAGSSIPPARYRFHSRVMFF